MDLHGTNSKLNVYTHQNSWCNVWHRIKLLKYEQYKFSSCMNVGVPPLNVDNAIIHEEYLVGLHYSYYRNDPMKYLVAIVLSSWGSELVFACHKNVFSLGRILREHNRSHSLDCCTESLVLGRPLFCSSIADYKQYVIIYREVIFLFATSFSIFMF